MLKPLSNDSILTSAPMHQATLRRHFYSTPPAPRAKPSRVIKTSNKRPKSSPRKLKIDSIPARIPIKENTQLHDLQSLEHEPDDITSGSRNISVVPPELPPEDSALGCLKCAISTMNKSKSVRPAVKPQLIVKLRLPHHLLQQGRITEQDLRVASIEEKSSVPSPKAMDVDDIGANEDLSANGTTVSATLPAASLETNSPSDRLDSFEQTVLSRMKQLRQVAEIAKAERDEAIQASEALRAERDRALAEAEKESEERREFQARAMELKAREEA